MMEQALHNEVYMLDMSEIQPFIDRIEAKDTYTQGHSHHVYVITKAIINCLPERYKSSINMEKICQAALLHDIGKVNIADEVLNKEGALTDEEWEIMRSHPMEGCKILQYTKFANLSDWILYHHERIDGRGYYGLPGDKIPLESKIISIADTFSALRTYRIYRPALSIEKTVEIMSSLGGTQLDKEILDCFLSLDADYLEKLECNCDICRERRERLFSEKSVNI